MTEQLHQDNDPQAPSLPEVSRETFVPAVHPPAWSKEAAEAAKKRTYEFEAIDAEQPDGLRNFEVLRVGHVLNIPTQARDEAGAPLPDTIEMTPYRVRGTSVVDGRLMADVVDPSGIEDSISADVFARQQKDLDNLKQEPDEDIGVAVARQLLELDGIDVHDPATKLIDTDT